MIFWFKQKARNVLADDLSNARYAAPDHRQRRMAGLKQYVGETLFERGERKDVERPQVARRVLFKPAERHHRLHALLLDERLQKVALLALADDVEQAALALALEHAHGPYQKVQAFVPL